MKKSIKAAIAIGAVSVMTGGIVVAFGMETLFSMVLAHQVQP